MVTYALLWAAFLEGQTKVDEPQIQNAVYSQVRDQGIQAGGQAIHLPAPHLLDGQNADAQRAALREVAGSDRAVDDLLRKSITAPYIIKVHDVKASDATIRAADVWFVVYADLKQIDFAREAARTDGKEVEVANMWFQTRLLKPAEIRAAGREPSAVAAGQNSWYSHVHARLLDRIDFEVTNHVAASQSADSIVVASRTDPAFANAGQLRSAWKPLSRAGGSKTEGSSQPYAGGISYAKVTRAVFKPGALLIEMHMAFVEPDGWFRGAPILRSKFSLIAQDQIRSLRRELAANQAK
jgi:hypothetical protein